MMLLKMKLSRRNPRTIAIALVVLAVAGPLSAPTSAGPVMIIDQHRSISAGVSGPQPADDHRDSVAGGEFNETVSAASSGEGYANRAWASIESSFTPSGIRFLARHGYEIEDDRSPSPGQEDDFVTTDAVSGATMDVHFRLDEPVRYTFSADSRQLVRDERIGFNNDHPLWFFGDNHGGVEEGAGVLAAGEYHLSWGGGCNAIAGWADARSSLWEYDLAVTFAPLDGGGGSGGAIVNPVPLPPAVWSGAAILAVAALNRLRKPRLA